jgi:hypothetical protein
LLLAPALCVYICLLRHTIWYAGCEFLVLSIVFVSYRVPETSNLLRHTILDAGCDFGAQHSLCV